MQVKQITSATIPGGNVTLHVSFQLSIVLRPPLYRSNWFSSKEFCIALPFDRKLHERFVTEFIVFVKLKF